MLKGPVAGQMDPESSVAKSGAGSAVRQATDNIVERFKIDLANQLALYRPDITRNTAHELATSGHLLLQPGNHTQCHSMPETQESPWHGYCSTELLI